MRFFAQGFATAQDRLWHMDYDRHRALGRWAEFVGEAGLGQDRLMRTFGVERAARADLIVSSEAARNMLEAYAAGVNAFIATTSALPVEYRLVDARPEPWEAWHCLAVYKVRNMLMGTFEMKLWRARLALALGPERAAPLFRGYPDQGLVSVPPGETYGGEDLNCLDELAAAVAELDWLGEGDGGSNAWVISGERTASGLPLVAGDSHRALDTPNVYYQTHITCPEFRCSGYALPGVPGMPHFSHNDHVAWGMTHGFGDYQDLYIERFRNSDGRLEYAAGDEWRGAEVATEQLRVRYGESRALRVVRTRHGPIIAGEPERGHGIAFSHTGTNSGTAWPNTLFDLLLAKSADEAEEALREWTEPVNNFVYADVHGAFGYRYRGRIPVRSMANAWVPVPGWKDEHEWQGKIPFEEMPQARNPQAGLRRHLQQRADHRRLPALHQHLLRPGLAGAAHHRPAGGDSARNRHGGGHGVHPRGSGVDSGGRPGESIGGARAPGSGGSGGPRHAAGVGLPDGSGVAGGSDLQRHPAPPVRDGRRSGARTHGETCAGARWRDRPRRRRARGHDPCPRSRRNGRG